MIGTEKQIKWAEKIKAEKIIELEKHVAFLAKRFPAGKQAHQAQAALEFFHTVERAAAWIGVKTYSAKALVRLVTCKRNKGASDFKIICDMFALGC